MGSRLLAVLPRIAAVVLVCVLTGATISFAADQGSAPTPAPTAPAEPPPPADLVVPDVAGQVYVFAKGTLEDAGFAWKIAGSVQGYAANTVVSQSPAAGTRLVDTGAPLVELRLAANAAYPEVGAPENASPFLPTAVRLAGAPGEVAAGDGPMTPGPDAPAETKAPAPAAKPKPAAKPAPAAAPAKAVKLGPPAPAKAAPRTPAFEVAGAPAEPAHEITLPQRAKQLRTWVRKHPKPTDANVKHWLFQHTWIVAGAEFGWSGGVEALELLVTVDREVERVWGVGTRSRLIAEAALKNVRARTG